MTRIMKHRLFWPAFCLLALVVVNTLARPQFIKVTVRDGELYGAPIDIVRQSAPLMLVALGMTLVIATRGIDLSVGAVMAISGAVSLTIIDDSASPGSVSTVLVALAVGIAAQLDDGVAHGGQIDDGRHSGEILHEDAGRHERDFLAGLGLGIPPGQGLNVVGLDALAVFVAEQVFEQNAERKRQLGSL